MVDVIGFMKEEGALRPPEALARRVEVERRLQVPLGQHKDLIDDLVLQAVSKLRHDEWAERWDGVHVV